MKFWDGEKYRAISPGEAKFRIASGHVPVVNAPEGDGCAMCADDVLHVHAEKPTTTVRPADPEDDAEALLAAKIAKLSTDERSADDAIREINALVEAAASPEMEIRSGNPAVKIVAEPEPKPSRAGSQKAKR